MVEDFRDGTVGWKEILKLVVLLFAPVSRLTPTG